MPAVVAISLLMLGTAFLLPGHYPPWLSFQNESLAALSIAGLASAAAAKSSIRPGQAPTEFVIPASAIALSILALVPLVQWTGGRVAFRTDAALVAGFLSVTAFSIVVGLRLMRQHGSVWIDAIALMFVVAGAMSVAVQLHQWLHLSESIWRAELPPGERPSGNLAQPNQLASLLMLSVISTWRLFERRRLGVTTAITIAVWLIWGLAMSQSRAGLLAMTVWGVWLVSRRRHVVRRTYATAFAAFAALSVGAFAAWAPLSDALLLDRVLPIEGRGRMQAGTRPEHWANLLQASIHRFWFGFGSNQTSSAQLAWAVDHPSAPEWLDSAHNLVLDLALWQGWPLALAVIGGAIVWMVRRWRRLDGATTAAVGDADTLWPWLLTLASYATVEYPYRYLYFLVPAGLFVGSIEHIDERLSRVDGHRSALVEFTLPRGVVVFITGAVFAATAWVAVSYLPVEESYRRMRLAMLGVGSPQAVLAESPRPWLMDGLLAFQDLAMTPARAGVSEDEWRRARQAVERWPMPPALLRLSLLAGLNARPAEAAGYLRAICHMNVRARCVEARESWAALQRQHPVLQSIPLPDLPPGR